MPDSTGIDAGRLTDSSVRCYSGPTPSDMAPGEHPRRSDGVVATPAMWGLSHTPVPGRENAVCVTQPHVYAAARRDNPETITREPRVK